MKIELIAIYNGALFRRVFSPKFFTTLYIAETFQNIRIQYEINWTRVVDSILEIDENAFQ